MTERSKILIRGGRNLGIMNFMVFIRPQILTNIVFTARQNRLGRLFGTLIEPKARLFFVTLLFYLSLYFSINNRSFLFLSSFYVFILWRIIKNIRLAIFFVFIATLSFAKGKGFQIIILPLEEIPRWAFYKISYWFPLYLSDLFLFGLLFIYIRDKLLGRTCVVPRVFIIPLFLLILFMIWVLLGAFLSYFSGVILLSVIQLLRMAVIFCVIVLVFQRFNLVDQGFYSIISASVIFQSLWAFLERFFGGPLGRDIEAILPGAEFGIRSSENPGLLRISGTFFEPSILGTFFLMHIGLLSVAILENRIKFSFVRKAAVLAIILGSVALLYTGSRVLYGYWLMLVIFLLTHYGRRYQKKIREFKKRLNLLISVVMMVLAIIIIPFVAIRLAALSDVFTQYGSGSYRLQMFAYSIRLALAKPFMGVGINLSPYYLATGFSQEQFVFDPTYPHNLLFQLLAETGIAGLILFSLFVYAVLRPFVISLWSKVKVNEFGLAAIIYLLAAQIYPIFLNQQEILSFFFLYAGLYLATINERYA